MSLFLALRHRAGLNPARPNPDEESDRGDVPGWVMVTLMTAGLVVALWSVASEQLGVLFQTAISRVLAGG